MEMEVENCDFFEENQKTDSENKTCFGEAKDIVTQKNSEEVVSLENTKIEVKTQEHVKEATLENVGNEVFEIVPQENTKELATLEDFTERKQQDDTATASSIIVSSKSSEENENLHNLLDINENECMHSPDSPTKEIEEIPVPRRWNLASFLYPDGNLPQSWLDIIEKNKKMSPFDDLQIKGRFIAKTTKTTDKFKEGAASASPDSATFCGVFGIREKAKAEVIDPELASMPELTLSVPEKNYPGENESKKDFEKELSSDAPTIQPYDSDIQRKSNPNELPKLIKQIKTSEEESESNQEVSIQIRIIETRNTRKIGVHNLPSTVATKSMKRKHSSIIHQQQHLLNNRIKNQISMMQRETKKKVPDIEFIRRNMCLEETFKYRMVKFMKDNEHSIEDLLKEFPALKIVSIIMDEFERVVEVTNPMVRCNPISFLENALKRRFQRIISKFRQIPLTDQLPIVSTALNKLDNDYQNETLKKIVSSLCMIINFSTDRSISSVITFRKEKEVFNYQSIGLPKMIMKEKSVLQEQTEIRVFLEGQEIFKVVNIYEGLLAIFAISHVFNLDYDAKIEPLMRYFEYLVDIPQVLYQEEDPLPSDDEIEN